MAKVTTLTRGAHGSVLLTTCEILLLSIPIHGLVAVGRNRGWYQVSESHEMESWAQALI